MPNFAGMKLTRHGMELLGLVGAGTVLDFTRIAVGSGIWNESQLNAPAELTALVHEAMSLDIGSIAPSSVPDTDEPAGCYTLHAMLTNAGLVSGFALREIGIFATHPSRGEILYAVDYAGDQYDYIPQLPAGAAPLEKQFRIDVVTGNAAEITIMQSPVLLATQDDIVVHDVDPDAHPDLLARLATGMPELISPADGATNISETPIISAHEFVPIFANTEHQASQWQVDLGSGDFSNPVFDSGPSSVALNSFELPAGYLQVSTLYKVRTRRRLNTGQWSPWSEPKSFTTRSIFNYAERPANTLPVADATNVQECPTFMSGPFAVVGDTADTHAGIQFRIRQGDTVLHLSPELGVVLEYLMPAGLLQVSTDYVFECRHKGTLLGWSEWSTATGFRTASAFIVGDEAVYFSAWSGHDNASVAGVALADGAELRSVGVDQDVGEADWVKKSVRAKVRDPFEFGVDPNTTAQTLIISTSKSVNLPNGSKFYVGDEGAELIEVISANIEVLADHVAWDGTSWGPFGDNGGIADSSAVTGVYFAGDIFDGIKEIDGFTILQHPSNCFHHSVDSVMVQITQDGLTWSDHLLVNDVRSCTITKVFAKVACKGIRLLAASDTGGGGGYIWCVQELAFSGGAGTRVFGKTGAPNQYIYTQDYHVFSCSDLSPALPSAPAHVLPPIALKVATGPAGTPFIANDFGEIAIAVAILGTDSDPDRPTFVVFFSVDETPAESFRRVALGVSGLSEGSECRVSETQIDIWKQGA